MKLFLFAVLLSLSFNSQAVLLMTASGETYDVISLPEGTVNEWAFEIVDTSWWDNPALAIELSELWFDSQGMNPVNTVNGENESLWFGYSTNNTGIDVAFCRDDSTCDTRFEIPSLNREGFFAIEVSQVPLPAAAWFFLSGLAWLGYRGRSSAKS